MEENLPDKNIMETSSELPGDGNSKEAFEEKESGWDTKKIIIFAGAIIGIITLILVGISVLSSRSQKTEIVSETAEKATTELSATSKEAETTRETTESVNIPSRTSTGVPETQAVNTIFAPKTDGILKIAVPVGKTVFSELSGNFPKVEKEKLLIVEIDPALSNFSSTQAALKASLSSLSSEMINGGSIELYIFKGMNDFGPSEAILLKNNLSAEENWALAKKSEATMDKDWKEFILIGEKLDIVASAGQKEFVDGSTAKTRYVNFTNDGAVSLDYLAGNGYLLFANSYSIKKRILENNTF